MPYSYKESFELVPFNPDIRRGLWKSDVEVKFLHVPRENGTFFTPGNLFHFWLAHLVYTLILKR